MFSREVTRQILSSPISPRAQVLWTQLSLRIEETSHEVGINTKTLASEMGYSVDTLRRALRVLKENGLLVDTSKRQKGRIRIYELRSTLQPTTPVSSPSTLGGEGFRVRSKTIENTDEPVVREYPTVKVPVTPNDILIDKLLREHGEEWRLKYYSLDGRAPRASVAYCVRKAILSPVRERFSDNPVEWAEDWLKTWAKDAMYTYQRDLMEASRQDLLSRGMPFVGSRSY